MHFIRHATVNNVRVKKPARAPRIIAPKKLVAAKVTKSSIIEVKIVPKMPENRAERLVQMQRLLPDRVIKGDAIRVRARKPVAIANATIKKTGVGVMTAVILRNAATTPITRLKTNVNAVQLFLQLQLNNDIFFTSAIIYAIYRQDVKRRFRKRSV